MSGIYPHLAMTNDGGNECGIGVAAAWADRLWFITYPAHRFQGSDDRLHSIDADMELTYYPQSPGGTHAGRMIHRESNQLIVGPCLIDARGEVRCIPPERMPGRITGIARHLTDPANRVYFFTMEEGLYEVDVHDLSVKILHEDGNGAKSLPDLLPGDHGKSAYTAQGVLIVAQNGSGGVLAEWDGSGNPGIAGSWRVVDRNKYTDVTGPGGIRGAPDRDTVAWAIGWDSLSVLLQVREQGRWRRFRLPKASFTYDADSGWYTEWPRICDIGDGPLLMNAHGMFFDFPREFSASNSQGIRPIAVHLKMVVDATAWNGRIVMAANDASMQGNPLLAQPQSNLWFGQRQDLRRFGAPSGWGGVWLRQGVASGEISEPFLVAGFERRVLHLSHEKKGTAHFAIEIDAEGKGRWKKYRTIAVPASPRYAWHILPATVKAEWVRIRAEEAIPAATAWFHCSSNSQVTSDEPTGPRRPELVQDRAVQQRRAGLLRPLEGNALRLGQLSIILDPDGNPSSWDYYTINGGLRMSQETAPESITASWPPARDYLADTASVRIQSNGAVYRLPYGERTPRDGYSQMPYRGIREVVSERYLANMGGTFFELPRPDAGGWLKIRPIATHNRRIFDFASWRGMLVMTGNMAGLIPAGRLVRSADGRAESWLGNVDDLWGIGPPFGEGGPWRQTLVKAGVPSDPYLMTGYDRKSVEFSHDSTEFVRFTIEVDFLADGSWYVFDTVRVPRDIALSYALPTEYSAHWVRVKTDRDCRASAQFTYR